MTRITQAPAHLQPSSSQDLPCTAPNKIQASLQTHKDKQDTQDKAGVYRIPWECGKVYIGEIGPNISTRVKEHQAHGRLGHLDKSAIITHSHEQDHGINWKETKLIAAVQFWHQRRVREAIEIKSHNAVFINDIWSTLLKATLPKRLFRLCGNWSNGRFKKSSKC